MIPLLFRSIKKNIFSKIINQNKTYAVLGKNEIFIHNNIKNNNCTNFILNLSTSEYHIPNDEKSTDYNILNINLSSSEFKDLKSIFSKNWINLFFLKNLFIYTLFSSIYFFI